MLLIILALVGTSGLFYFAGVYKNRGIYWADRLCDQGSFFCEQPRWLFLALSVVIVVGMIRTMTKA